MSHFSSHLWVIPLCHKQNTQVNIPRRHHLFSLSLDLSNSSPTHYSFQQHFLSIHHTDGKLVSTLQDFSSLLGRNIVSNLSTVGGVVHHQKLEVLHIANNELVESVGEHVLGGSVRTITNVRHQSGTSEATSAASINTLGLSPVLLHKRLDNPPVAYQKRTFILLNLSAWKRGKEVNFFFTILTL